MKRYFKPEPIRFVYCVSSADNPEYRKIGVATDLKKRLASIQTGNPYKLDLDLSVAIEYAAASRLEKIIHDALSRYRCEGEWFRCDVATVMRVIKTTLKYHLEWNTGVYIANPIPNSFEIQCLFRLCKGSLYKFVSEDELLNTLRDCVSKHGCFATHRAIRHVSNLDDVCPEEIWKLEIVLNDEFGFKLCA